MTRLERLQQQLRDAQARRAELRGQILALAEIDGEFTAEQDEQYRGLNSEFDELGPRIGTLEGEVRQLEAVLSAPETSHERVGLTLVVPDRDDPFAAGREFAPSGQVRSTALRAVEQADGVPDSVRATLERSVRRLDSADGALSRHIVAHMRPEYRSFMAKYMAGREYSATDAERAAAAQARAVNITTDSEGGFGLVPTYDLSLILTGAHDGLAQPMWRTLATTRQIVGGDTWNGLSSGGVTASWDGEAEEVSDDSPDFAQPSITVKKAQAFMEYTFEAGEDFDGLEAIARELFATAKADLEAEAFSKQTAPTAKQPNGLIYKLVGTTSEVNGDGSEALALSDIGKLLSTVPARHRPRSTFMAEISTYTKLNELAAAAGDLSVWNQLDANVPGTIRGRPAVENPSMTGWADVNTGATASNYLMVLGDFSAYYIIDRVGMTVEFVPHLFHTGNNRPKGTRGLLMHWRVGADVVDTGRFALLDVPTTA